MNKTQTAKNAQNKSDCNIKESLAERLTTDEKNILHYTIQLHKNQQNTTNQWAIVRMC